MLSPNWNPNPTTHLANAIELGFLDSKEQNRLTVLKKIASRLLTRLAELYVIRRWMYLDGPTLSEIIRLAEEKSLIPCSVDFVIEDNPFPLARGRKVHALVGPLPLKGKVQIITAFPVAGKWQPAQAETISTTQHFSPDDVWAFIPAKGG
jgi:hypothetical protein